MENQDKLYEQFKEASNKAEQKGFDRMEAVWNRVEEKLDDKRKRRALPYWKYAGIAAMLLLCLTVGTFIFRNESQPAAPNVLPENNVTVIDTAKVNKLADPEDNSVVKEEVVVNDNLKSGSYNPTNNTLKTSAVEADSVFMRSITKKARVWNSNTAQQSLDEVVITGYVVTKKESRTGSIAEITPPIVANNVLQGTQGRVAGMDLAKPYGGNENIVLRGRKLVTTNSTHSGEFKIKGEITKQKPTPSEKLKGNGITMLSGEIVSDKSVAASIGKDIKIRGTGSITGNKQPLCILDGEPVSAKLLEYVSSDWIESIEVLKNQSAINLYGNKASEGAIIMKSKQLPNRETRKLKNLIKKYPYKEAPPISIDTEEYESFTENQFENPATTPLSTFSIDVDNASYTNVRRFLNNGQTVPKDAVRVEEMINFFKYQYPQPTANEPFSINTEYSDAPWNPNHKLLKIGLQGKEIPTESLPASNFVFLIDVSGSMSDANKLPLLKQSMKLLVNQMRPKDKLAIVVYAGAAGLVLPPTSGDEKAKIIAALDNLNAGGSTAGGAGIDLAYKTAQENFIKGGNNRVILATDGDFNVGASSDKDMQTLIEEKRKSGVFLTCLGYGMGNYKDSKMEILADKGNGNYAYIDNMQEADRFLQKEFKGSMYAIAKDVKIQIEFNPKHVQSYRLIGYENRKLRDEDFANDAIDAGELGSGHNVTALYEIIPVGVKSDYFTPSPGLKYSTPTAATGNYNDELATIKFRHKKPDADTSTEIVKVIPNTIVPAENATGDFKFVAAVAWFGLKLRDSKLVPNKAKTDIKRLAQQGLQNDTEGYRAEFVRLVEMVE